MKILSVIILFLIMIFTGCTSNQSARNWGGTMKINLAPGQKLVTATWKEANLWYLTRPSREGEKPEVSTFHEDSNIGVMNGKVIFIEH